MEDRTDNWEELVQSQENRLCRRTARGRRTATDFW